MNTTEIAALSGVILGLCGFVLSIINTWNQLQRNHIHLRVRPRPVVPVGSMSGLPVNFCIEVVNLSEFAVVLADTGFRLTHGRRGTLSTVRGIEPSGRLPLRLEPHTVYEKEFWMDRTLVDLAAVRGVYAQTQCGTTVYGNSPALVEIVHSVMNHGT